VKVNNQWRDIYVTLAGPILSKINKFHLFVIAQRPEELQLTELENVLIAKNILFLKLFGLPKK